MEEVVVAQRRPMDRFAFHRNTTFVTLLIGYAGYYLCRQNLSAAILPMEKELGVTAAQFGWISSIGTAAYALGKVFTGSLADHHGSGKRVFYVGLIGSAVACWLFGLGSGLAAFALFWAINRAFQSMGWGGLVNVMAHWFPRRSYGTAMGWMSMSYQFGSVLASLFAGMILSFGFGWKALFWIPGGTLLLIGALGYPWLKASPEAAGLEPLPVEAVASTSMAPEEEEEKKLGYWHRYGVLLTDRGFLAMLGLSFLLTMLRECFNLWMPLYFAKLGAQASVAVFKSAIFPLLGCAGTLFAGWFSDRYLGGRRAPVMAALMLGLIASLLALASGDAASAWAARALGPWFTPSNTAAVLVGLTGFFLLGPYSLVGGVVAIDFGGRKTPGTAAGLLDGAGYLGAVASGIGVATLLADGDWGRVYLILASLSVLGLGIAVWLWARGARRA